MIRHRVTLGLPSRAGALTAADETLSSAGIAVFDQVPIDHTAEAKANAVLMQDVANNSTIVNVPARSITMKRSPTDV